VRSIDVTKLLKAEFDKAAKTVNQSVKQAIKEIKSKKQLYKFKSSHMACLDDSVDTLVKTIKSILTGDRLLCG
jgi:hypothetical protein